MSDRGGTFYADAAQLRAWFDGAGPGHCAVYATGPALDRANETVRTVVGWRDAGLVTCVQRRDGAALKYQIQKRVGVAAPSLVASAPLAVASTNPASRGMPGGSGAPLSLPGRGDPSLDEGDFGRVYRLIARAANLGAACPTNGQIAELLELNSRFHGRRLFDRLVSEGHLRVIEGNRFGARIVEICASGLRTGNREKIG